MDKQGPLEPDPKQPEEGEGGDGEGGTTGGGILWSTQDSELFRDLSEWLSPEQLHLLEKMVRGHVVEGHKRFGNRAIQQLLRQEAYRQMQQPSSGAASSRTVERHPRLPQGTGLQAQISPNWQNQNRQSEQDLTPALKAQLKYAPKLRQMAQPKPVVRYDDKPRPTPPRLTRG